jgi:hypothetical protein
MRTAVDPVTLAPLPDGEIGIARPSIRQRRLRRNAIQTADLRGFLPGPRGTRSSCSAAPGAPPRDARIAVDDMLGPP